jgi:flavoprotein
MPKLCFALLIKPNSKISDSKTLRKIPFIITTNAVIQVLQGTVPIKTAPTRRNA